MLEKSDSYAIANRHFENSPASLIQPTFFATCLNSTRVENWIISNPHQNHVARRFNIPKTTYFGMHSSNSQRHTLYRYLMIALFSATVIETAVR